MLKKLKLLKKPLSQKRRWPCDFLPRKTLVAQKHRAISRQEKDGILYPRRVVLGLPYPSHRVCADGRTYGRTDVRMDGHVTITSEPKFLGLIVYQISLAMELHWPALPAGSAIISEKLPKTVLCIFKSARISDNLQPQNLCHRVKNVWPVFVCLFSISMVSS